jgi:hypothetical protein
MQGVRLFRRIHHDRFRDSSRLRVPGEVSPEPVRQRDVAISIEMGGPNGAEGSARGLGSRWR